MVSTHFPVLAEWVNLVCSVDMQLLGREYYHTAFEDRYLLLLPFAIHVASGEPSLPSHRTPLRLLLQVVYLHQT
ncbi:hypothetical protein EDC04DRAFT_2745799 [Pisolithus marmoratus]|nr:hypothetical protein EDC04DRAFT_2745799 [Pisolithus marmoratus]